MESRREQGNAVPGWTPEFGTRLADLYQQVGGLVAASKICGVSDETLGKYRDGQSRPNLFPLAQLCAHAKLSLDWLACNEDSRHTSPPQQEGRDQVWSAAMVATRSAIAAAETLRWLDENNLELDAEPKGQLIRSTLQALMAPGMEGKSNEELKLEATRVLDVGMEMVRAVGFLR